MRQGRHEALAVAALAALAVAGIGAYLWRRQAVAQRPVLDYSNRSGFPRPPHEMRGIARRQPSRAIMA